MTTVYPQSISIMTKRSKEWRARSMTALGVPALALLVAACGNEPVAAPKQSLDVAVWQVRTPDHGVTLAVGDTYQMHAAAINLNGNPVPVDSATPFTYVSDDTTYVRVSSTGLITGMQATGFGAPAHVIVSLRQDNVLRQDTVFVSVTDTRQSVASISIQIAPPDSAKIAVLYPKFLTPMALDSDGNPVPGVFIALRAPSNVLLDPIFAYMLSVAPGKVWIYATANAYGQSFTDSLEFEFINKTEIDFSISQASNGTLVDYTGYVDHTAFLQPCGIVTWTNTTNAPFDVTFDDPSKTGVCGVGDVTETGNALNVAVGSTVTRKFPTVSTVQWTVAKSATPTKVELTGKIGVK